MSDIRLDGIHHIPYWNKTETIIGNVSMTAHVFPVVIAIPGFVSIKIDSKSTIETLEQDF